MKSTAQTFKSTAASHYRDKMFYTILFLFVVFGAFSQQKISGKITDENNFPLPGVLISEKKTTNVVVSDFDGNFEIVTKENEPVLVFSYIGLKTKEVKPDGKKVLNIILESNSNELTEVVVVGYGTQKKSRVTSAIASIKEKDFTKGAIRDASDLIRGKVAGLTISNGSGDPSAEPTILLRGISSLKGSNTPLVLINGVPGGINTVSPNEIASIEVLKDASAAAIYGTRGANGVILITTKTVNKEMAPTLTYSTFASVSNFYNKADFLNAAEQRNLIAQGVKLPFTDGGASTDWLDEISGSGFTQSHNLDVKGGTGRSNYAVNLNYVDQTGVFNGTSNKELRFSFDVNHKMFNDKLKINLNLLNGTQKMKLSEGTTGYAYRQAMIRNPTAPVYNADGTYNEKENGEIKFQYYNPVAIMNETKEDRDNTWQRFTANLTLDLLPGWDTSLLLAKNKNSALNGYAETKKHYSNTLNELNGVASRSTGDTDRDFLEFTSKYNKKIDKHEFTVLGGYSYQYTVNQGFSAYNFDFPTDTFSYNNLNAGNALSDGNARMGSYKNDDKLIGFFGRANYNFDSKYDLLFSIRREGSSKFGENNKWGNFPAVSAGWSIHKESFLKEVSYINNFKLRAGYGITGVIPNDSYQSLTLYNYEGYFFNDGKWVKGLEPASNPNPDLRWEKTAEVNIGLDFGFLDNRISGSVDVYSKKTSDMLWDYAVPIPPNIYGSTMANVGKMENKGFEILLNVIPVKSENFIWNSSMTFSHNKNKLTSLSNDLYSIDKNYINTGNTGDPISFSTHRLEVGQSIGNYWGLKSVDITHDMPKPEDNGKWIIETADGTRKTLIPALYTDENKQYLGNGIPQYYAGWTNTFTYKKFDLSVVLTGAFDFKILNSQRMFYENPTTNYNMLASAFDKVYDKAVLNYNQTYVSYYLEKGDYVKVDNITLSYNFNVKPYKVINAMRLYFSGNNLATFTKYKGLDPEIQRGDPLSQGMDNRDKYPSTTSLTLGLNVTF